MNSLSTCKFQAFGRKNIRKFDKLSFDAKTKLKEIVSKKFYGKADENDKSNFIQSSLMHKYYLKMYDFS